MCLIILAIVLESVARDVTIAIILRVFPSVWCALSQRHVCFLLLLLPRLMLYPLVCF